MSHEIRKAVKLNDEALDQVGGGKLIDGWENAVKQYVDMALQDPARYNMSFDEFWGVAKGITGSVQQFGTSDKDVPEKAVILPDIIELTAVFKAETLDKQTDSV